MSLSESIAGQAVQEAILTTGGRVYIGLAGQSKVTGGRPWTELPLNLSQAGAAGSIGSGADAGQFVPLLEQQGEAAQLVGTATVDGAQTTEYQVTMNRATYIAAEERGLMGVGLPPAVLKQAEEDARAESTPIIHVWVDATGDIRQIGLKQTETTPGACAATPGAKCPVERLTVVLNAMLSDFGRAVEIQAPAPSRVVTYAAFLRDEEHPS
jgi:hypothetical protein